MKCLQETPIERTLYIYTRLVDASFRLCFVKQDTVIFERLQDKQMYKDSTVEHLEDFAKEGKSTVRFGEHLFGGPKIAGEIRI